MLGKNVVSLHTRLGNEKLNKIERILRSIRLKFLVCEHRDFGPWNIHIENDGSIGVVDWVDARPYGLPLLDLVYFLANTTFHHDGAWETGDFSASYSAFLDPDSYTGKHFHKCISVYASSLGIAPEDIGPLRLLCWLIQATEENVSINKGFFFQLIEVELERYA